MDLQLAGKRALVTGGSRGIGRAIARQLALEGANVAIGARDRDALEAAASELSSETGRTVVSAAGDTGDDASARGMVTAAAHALGGLDVLVNAAARPSFGLAPGLDDVTEQALWEQVNVKVMGYIRTAQSAAPYMIANGWGRIINVSGLNARSSHSLIGSIRNVGVAAMTKNLADQLGAKGINVTVVHPGPTRTERTPAFIAGLARQRGISEEQAEAQLVSGTVIDRMVDATEVADVVAFLASPRSVAITGDAIACGGGVRGVIHY